MKDIVVCRRNIKFDIHHLHSKLRSSKLSPGTRGSWNSEDVPVDECMCFLTETLLTYHNEIQRSTPGRESDKTVVFFPLHLQIREDHVRLGIPRKVLPV